MRSSLLLLLCLALSTGRSVFAQAQGAAPASETSAEGVGAAAPASSERIDPARSKSTTKDFTLRFYAGFLEPGLGGLPAVPGNELESVKLEWQSQTEGRLTFTVWKLKGWAAFKTTPDRGQVIELKTNMDDPAGVLAQVWRKRHGYSSVGGGAYRWDSNTDENPVSMDPGLGALYDRYLRDVWRLWAMRGVRRMLKADPASVPGQDAANAGESEAADPGVFQQKIALRYERDGLIGRPSFEVPIRTWSVPVRVSVHLRRQKPVHDFDMIIGLARPIEVRTDLTEMRRRYGYRKDKSGAYAWNSDFSDPGLPKEALGPKIDELIERAMGFWADGSVSVIMGNLNGDLIKAIEELPAQAQAPASATEELKRTATSIDWPGEQ